MKGLKKTCAPAKVKSRTLDTVAEEDTSIQDTSVLAAQNNTNSIDNDSDIDMEDERLKIPRL